MHYIFEKIGYNRVHAPKDVDGYILGERLSDWRPVVSQMIIDTLHMPLDLVTGPCRLYELDPSCLKVEWEFLVPSLDGFIRGFVDLLFEHQGYYYLVDWKSNWLGPDAHSYVPERLEECMRSENYDLQLQLYTEALKRYLRLIDTRPFEECFGGAFYLFLRGIPEKYGIYHVKRLDI